MRLSIKAKLLAVAPVPRIAARAPVRGGPDRAARATGSVRAEHAG